MQKLLALITLAISTIAGFKSAIADSRKALADRDALIVDLKGQLDSANADHQALLERANAAEAHSAELDAANVEANAKADELAAALTAEPSAPSVDPATFAVTAQPTAAPEAAPAASGDQTAQ